MRKFMKRIALCACFSACFWAWGLLADRETLNEELIRLHVVAASDSEEDQSAKLRVRDAVLESISEDLAGVTDMAEARVYIQNNLPKIQQVANDTLKALGFEEEALATWKEEIFDTRFYDTFTLPAGVYDALRITIGEGEGKNWWCVAFPALCIPATAAEFEDVAAGAGFSHDLIGTLEGEYEIRFYLLDLLGRLEGYFFRG